MTKHLIATIVLFILSAISCYGSAAVNNSNISFILFFPTVIFSMTFVGFLGITATKIINKNASSYKAFAIVESIYSVCLIIFAIVNLLGIGEDISFFDSIFRGLYLLITVIPTAATLLIADFKLWARKNNIK